MVGLFGLRPKDALGDRVYGLTLLLLSVRKMEERTNLPDAPLQMRGEASLRPALPTVYNLGVATDPG